VKVAVHAHVHYIDLMDAVAKFLGNIPFAFDLYVTITDANAKAAVRSAVRAQAPKAKLTVLPVVNRGRDVKPLYTDVAPLLKGYDVIGHIHAKKSSFNLGATTGWLEFLLDALMGSAEVVTEIFDLFRREPTAGLVYPGPFNKLPYWANTWLSNRGWAEELGRRLNIAELPASYFSYPMGNMFWARAGALEPLLRLGLTETDYPPEQGQSDGEIMHALERMVAVSALAAGFSNYIVSREAEGVRLIDQRFAFDLSSYHTHSLDALKKVISQRDIAVVSFDIFDTLIVRCLTDPSDIFELMQPEVERVAGQPVDFKRLRRDADVSLRGRLAPGRDVTLTEIYRRIGELLHLPVAETERLKALELRLEWKYMRVRSSMVEVMNFAWHEGKRVVLVSDMYLEKDFVEALLRALGVTAYHAMYLSSAIGKRKDNRTMFPYLLETEDIGPRQMIHVGDNEHSDLQIPGDLGIPVFHVMRPRELFGLTPLGKTGYPGPWERLPIAARVTAGLQWVRQLDHPFPSGRSAVNGDLHTFGYCYFGPVLLAFVRWVAERAREEGISKLFFLARDGDILIRIYRLLQAWLPGDSPEGVYLEVSRRSVGVPFIEGPEQLDKLLDPAYPGGPLAELIRIRLGIDLGDWPEIDVRRWGFSHPQAIVFIPADLGKIKRLAYHLHSVCAAHFEQEKEGALGYLRQMGFFDEGDKAVVDIGYSGTLQRILNDVSPDRPVHGYYMVLYRTIDTLLKREGARAKGLFGDRIDPYLKDLSIDRYSLFYEMVLSSVNGPVVNYAQDACGYQPVYAPVSPDEKDKLSKLPAIHEGILDYCRELLLLLEDHRAIGWDDPAFLLQPFQHFLENPTPADFAMLSGYSLDDYYCGQGILYWSPPESLCEEADADCLWKRYVPGAPLWCVEAAKPPERKWEVARRREQEIFHWYVEQYETMPRWYKWIGHLFKIVMGRKKIRIVLEDVGYCRDQPSRAEEIQAWYDKEYEVLPLWYKRVGQLVRIATGRRGWANEAQSTNTIR